MQNDFKQICDAVCATARRAGSYIAAERRTFTADKIEYKGEQNLVSYVDKSAQKMIIDELLAIVPAAIIAEESISDMVEPKNTVSQQQYTWIIDPLDGTTNFTHGLPPYCVSIALMCGSTIVVGVIYEITCDECFYAWAGSDCYVNSEKITVSKIDSIEKSLFLTGLSYKTENVLDGFRRSFDYFNEHSNGARRLGSAASDLAYIAAGRADCFCHANLWPWDVAAGAFLVQQAGGVVTDFDGGDNYIFGNQIIATNSAAHNIFYKKLKELL